jgi:hypothetical protein
MYGASSQFRTFDFVKPISAKDRIARGATPTRRVALDFRAFFHVPQ